MNNLEVYLKVNRPAGCQICHQRTTRYVVLGNAVCNDCNLKSPVDNRGREKSVDYWCLQVAKLLRP